MWKYGFHKLKNGSLFCYFGQSQTGCKEFQNRTQLCRHLLIYHRQELWRWGIDTWRLNDSMPPNKRIIKTEEEEKLISVADAKAAIVKTKTIGTFASSFELLANENGFMLDQIKFPLSESGFTNFSPAVRTLDGNLLYIYKLSTIESSRSLQIQLIDNLKKRKELKDKPLAESMLLPKMTLQIDDILGYVIESYQTPAKTLNQYNLQRRFKEGKDAFKKAYENLIQLH